MSDEQIAQLKTMSALLNLKPEYIARALSNAAANAREVREIQQAVNQAETDKQIAEGKK